MELDRLAFFIKFKEPFGERLESPDYERVRDDALNKMRGYLDDFFFNGNLPYVKIIITSDPNELHPDDDEG